MREVEIERLLQWAYRDELPKRGIGTLANRWEHVSDYGDRGGMSIDDEPGFPAAMGVPHVDADTIARAVDGLNDEVALDWSEYRGLLLADVIGIAPRHDVLAGRVFSETALVASFARMGERPRWNIGVPQPQAILHRGVVMLFNGECKDRDRYTPGTCCGLQYVSPSVDSVAYRRAEYMVWRGALERVAGILRAWTLRDHVALKPDAPIAPWLDGAASKQPDAISGVAPAFKTWVDEPSKAKPRQRRKAEVVPPAG